MGLEVGQNSSNLYPCSVTLDGAELATPFLTCTLSPQPGSGYSFMCAELDLTQSRAAQPPSLSLCCPVSSLGLFLDIFFRLTYL